MMIHGGHSMNLIDGICGTLNNGVVGRQCTLIIQKIPECHDGTRIISINPTN